MKYGTFNSPGLMTLITSISSTHNFCLSTSSFSLSSVLLPSLALPIIWTSDRRTSIRKKWFWCRFCKCFFKNLTQACIRKKKLSSVTLVLVKSTSFYVQPKMFQNLSPTCTLPLSNLSSSSPMDLMTVLTYSPASLSLHTLHCHELFTPAPSEAVGSTGER